MRFFRSARTTTSRHKRGLCAHYREIAAATGLPVILHDVPSRTVRGLTDESVARLPKSPRISDSRRNGRCRPSIAAARSRRSGFQASFRRRRDGFGILAQGGDGCISVVSNVAPGLCQRMYFAWRQGHVMRARRNMIPLAQLTAALARESNPAPLKYALSLCGLMSPRVRSPLAGVTEETRREILATLQMLWKKYADFMIERMLVPANPLVAAQSIVGRARLCCN